jgi:predicted small metal-binding protein
MTQDLPREESKITEMKEAGPVKQIPCDDVCGFAVHSRNEKELISAAREHLKTYHHMKMSDKDLKAKITEVSLK